MVNYFNADSYNTSRIVFAKNNDENICRYQNIPGTDIRKDVKN